MSRNIFILRFEVAITSFELLCKIQTLVLVIHPVVANLFSGLLTEVFVELWKLIAISFGQLQEGTFFLLIPKFKLWLLLLNSGAKRLQRSRWLPFGPNCVTSVVLVVIVVLFIIICLWWLHTVQLPLKCV